MVVGEPPKVRCTPARVVSRSESHASAQHVVPHSRSAARADVIVLWNYLILLNYLPLLYAHNAVRVPSCAVGDAGWGNARWLGRRVSTRTSSTSWSSSKTTTSTT